MKGFAILGLILIIEFVIVVACFGWAQPAPAIFQVVGMITALIGGTILVRSIW